MLQELPREGLHAPTFQRYPTLSLMNSQMAISDCVSVFASTSKKEDLSPTRHWWKCVGQHLLTSHPSKRVTAARYPPPNCCKENCRKWKFAELSARFRENAAPPWLTSILHNHRNWQRQTDRRSEWDVLENWSCCSSSRQNQAWTGAAKLSRRKGIGWKSSPLIIAPLTATCLEPCPF